MQEESSNSSRRIDLLDLIVIASENWKWLIVIPLAAGLLVFGAIKWLGLQQYQSDAVLSIDPKDVELLKSARVLDPVLAGSPWLNRYENSLTNARSALLRNLTVSKVEDTPFYRISFKASSPAEANNLLSGLIAELMKQSVPAGQNREDLTEEIAATKQELATLKETLKNLTDLAAKPWTPNGPTAGEIGQSIVALANSVEGKRKALISAERSLRGTVGKGDVIQSPVLPDFGTTSRQITIILFVMVMTGLATFAAATLREIIRRSLKLELNAERAYRIKRALSFKRA